MYVYYLCPLIPKKFNITYNKERRKIFRHNLQQRVTKDISTQLTTKGGEKEFGEKW